MSLSLSKKNIPLLLFGLAMGALALALELLQYKFFIGSLDKEVYTVIIATLFTGIGIWIGIQLFTKKPTKNDQVSEADPSVIKKLGLNPRELEVLQLIAQGYSNQEIADQLFLALPTIKTHTSNLYVKLDVKSRTQAVSKAQTIGLL